MNIEDLTLSELEELELQTYRERERFARTAEQAQNDYRIANQNLLAIEREVAKRQEQQEPEE